MTDGEDNSTFHEIEVGRAQTARYESIREHWLESIDQSKANDKGRASDANMAGWDLARPLCMDIFDADEVVSRAACRRVRDLAEFCVQFDAQVEDTVCPIRHNAIRYICKIREVGEGYDHSHNWMMYRGLMLLEDMQVVLHLLEMETLHLRELGAQALWRVSEICLEQERVSRESADLSWADFWAEAGDDALHDVERFRASAYRDIRDSAGAALRELNARRAWRGSLQRRRQPITPM